MARNKEEKRATGSSHAVRMIVANSDILCRQTQHNLPPKKWHNVDPLPISPAFAPQEFMFADTSHLSLSCSFPFPAGALELHAPAWASVAT